MAMAECLLICAKQWVQIQGSKDSGRLGAREARFDAHDEAQFVDDSSQRLQWPRPIRSVKGHVVIASTLTQKATAADL
jgi:hypothetical protein